MDEPKDNQSAFDKFRDFARKIVQVPKSEANEKEKEYQKQKGKTAKKKKPRRKKRGKAH